MTAARAIVAILLLVGCAIERGGGLIVDAGRGGRDAGGGRLDAGPSEDTGASTEIDGGPVEPGIDAGPDAGCVARGGQCEPGEISRSTVPCGACGSSDVEQRCNAVCLWETFPGPCTGEGECLPGSLTSIDDPGCTQCVRRIEHACDGSCRWVPTHGAGCNSSDTCEFGVEFCEGSRGGGFECCDGGDFAPVGMCGG